MLRFLRLIYGIYASLTFVIVVLVLFCPFIILGPTLPLRRAIGRLCVHAWLAVSFMRFEVRGLQHLPDGACVAACNHASYIDGLIVTGALPSRFTFLVQHGAADWPYLGLVLKRMGVIFVDRGSARGAARVTRELIERLRRGEAISIFPEGTFRAAAELRAFQPGAFLMAARARAPIAPLVLHGTRRLFGEGQRLLRHSRIEVECFAPIHPQGEDRVAATQLQDAVRKIMLAHCREADGLAAAGEN